MFALILVGWQLHGQPFKLYVWFALAIGVVILLVSWRQKLRPKRFELAGLEPASSSNWKARMKGRSATIDIEIVSWTRVGPLLGLDIIGADPNMFRARILLVSDQCSTEQWRSLLAGLNWMGSQK